MITPIVPAAASEAALHPGCSVCGVRPPQWLAQWQRRPTPDELAALIAAEEDRRAQILRDADPEQPPVFGPLPSVEDTTIPVYGCAEHAIHMDIAGRIHAADCGGCDCEPEPLPKPTPMPGTGPTITLPTGWTIPQPPEETP